MISEVQDAFAAHPVLVPVVAVVGIGFTVVYVAYRSMLPKPLPGIPYNKESAERFFGDIPNMNAIQESGGRRRLYFAGLARKYQSPIVQFFFPGMKPCIAICDYREARDLTLRRGKELLRGPLNCEPWMGLVPGHFIAMEDANPRYKGAKSLAKDLMTPSFLHSASAPASYEMVLNLIELWNFKAKAAAGAPFDASDDLSHMTFDIIAASALGVNPSESATIRHLAKLQAAKLSHGDGSSPVEFAKWDSPELLYAIFTIERAAGTALSLPSPRMFHFFNNHFNSEMRNANRVKNATLGRYIDQSGRRLAENPLEFKPRSAIDYMVFREAQIASKAGRKPPFHSAELMDGLIGYLIGGQDSTHSTLCFTVKRLGENQEIQRKLRESLRAAHADAYQAHRQPSADEITKTQVPYLDAFIQEVLRANPPAPTIARQAAQDMQILGHHIPKGTNIIFALEGPTFHDRGYQVPEQTRSESSAKHQGLGDWANTEYSGEEFHPERWLKPADMDGGESTYDGTRGPFMTFSSGTRACWGQRLAYLELKLITSLLVWNYQFDPIPDALNNWDIHEEIFSKLKNTLVKIRSMGDI